MQELKELGSATASRNPKLHSLQALRAVAAIMVVVGHSFAEVEAVPGYTGLIGEGSFNYHFGVDLFFVISGFIMIYTTARSERSLAVARKFIVSRIVRIVPIYWLLTLVTLLLSYIFPSGFNRDFAELAKIFGSFFFIPVRSFELDTFRADVMPILGLGWTLNYEMFFYVIFAASLLMSVRRGAFFVIFTLGVVGIYGFWFDPTQTQIRFWSDSIIWEFGFGVALGLGTSKLVASRHLASWALITSGAVLYAAAHFLTWPHELRFLVSGIPALMVVAGTVKADLSTGVQIPRFMSTWGDASYSIYLSHIFIIRALKVIWIRLDLPEYALVFCVIGVGGSIAAGMALTRYVELPIQRGLKKVIQNS